MKSVEEFRKNFESAFDTKLSKQLNALEKERIKVLIIGLLCFLMCFLCIFAVIYLFSDNVEWNDSVGNLCVAIILAGIIFFAVPSAMFKSFENKVKEQIMPRFLTALNFSWKDESKDYISDDILKESGLFEAFNVKYPDETFYGFYKNNQVIISETDVQHTGYGKGIGARRLFKGVLVYIETDRKYKGHTIIMHKKLPSLFPKKFVYDSQKLMWDYLYEIKTEDVIFSKKYNIKGTDQIEARCVLTTAFINRFNNLKFAFNVRKTDAALWDNKVIIALHSRKDLFKVAKIYKPVNDYRQFKKMVDEFASVLEIIDELKLYQNIGL